MNTLVFKPLDKDFYESIIVDEIQRFSRDKKGITQIHLKNGEVLQVQDELETLNEMVSNISNRQGRQILFG